jgi:hypothetical protein
MMPGPGARDGVLLKRGPASLPGPVARRSLCRGFWSALVGRMIHGPGRMASGGSTYHPGARETLPTVGRGSCVSAATQPSGGGYNPVRPLRPSGDLDAGRVPFVGEGCPETQPPRALPTARIGAVRWTREMHAVCPLRL